MCKLCHGSYANAMFAMLERIAHRDNVFYRVIQKSVPEPSSSGAV